MKRKLITKLVSSGLFAAVIFSVTAFLPRLPIAGGAGGYVHIGDAFIYLAACILPLPWAVAAAAIGAGLADALTGFIIWMPGTAITKALMVLPFSRKGYKLFTVRNAFASIIAGLVCITGYYLYEAAITMSFTIPLPSVLFNIIQAVMSTVIFITAAFALDRINFKHKLERGFSNEDF